MTIKTYKSTSVLSFSITLPNGSYRRIRFTPYSWGGGVYTTANEAEQQVLESMPWFGQRYVLVSTESDEEEAPSSSLSQKEEEKPENNEDNGSNEEVKTENIQVADFSEAKEYLMEHFGYNSSQLRSQKAITEAAAKNNIIFDYA